MKAILCDDEPRVCALIQRLVDWDGLGLTLAGTARDGCEALALMREVQPDIVVTDIRMPELDGIGLIKRAKDEGLRTKFVIISGYRQFEYAHTALQYGVDDYLLKPIQKDELNRTLKRLCSGAPAPASATSSPVLLRRHFIGNLLFGECPEQDFDTRDVNALCGCHFTDRGFAVLSLRPDATGIAAKVTPALLDEMLEAASEKGAALFNEAACVLHAGVVFCVVNLAGDAGQARFLQAATELHREMAVWARQKSCVVTLGMGAPRDEFAGIVGSMWEAIDCMKARVALGNGGVIAFSGLAFSDEPLDGILGQDWRGRWQLALEGMQPRDAADCIEGFFAAMAAWPNADPRLYYKLCAYIISTACEPPFGSGNASERDEQQAKMRHELLGCSTTACIQAKMVHFMQALMGKQAEVRAGQDRMPIRNAKRYIKEHYREQITLEDVAREVHFNPNYLSSLFKSEVGINFNEYLVQVRIDAAKALLRGDHCNIEQVAEGVGYQNVKYFSRLFRKVTGITPSKYRSLYS